MAPPPEPAPVLLQVDAPVVGLPPEPAVVPIPEQKAVPAISVVPTETPPALPPPAREEVVSGVQEQLVPGGRQIVQGETPTEAKSERSDAELIDAFENLLDRLF